MNNVYSNALPSRLIIAAGLAVVAIGGGAYYLPTASKAVPTAQVAPAPAPPPVAANPPPPAAPAPAPDVAAAAPTPAASPAVAQQDSSNANPTDSATPSES